jgi:glucosamine-6-phosphate deaminase
MGKNKIKVIICKDLNEISKRGADMVLKQVKNNPKSVLGLATGSSPIGTY